MHGEKGKSRKTARNGHTFPPNLYKSIIYIIHIYISKLYHSIICIIIDLYIRKLCLYIQLAQIGKINSLSLSCTSKKV